MSAPAPPRPARLSAGDVLRVGAAGLRARPLRIVLSAVGIAIGIAAMLAVVGISASSRAGLDRALAALGGTGLGYGQRINIAIALTNYATRQAAMVHALTGPPAPADDAMAGLADYSDILGQVLDPEGYPELTAAVRENAFGAATEWIDDADFTFGLNLLLDGIQTLITREPA